MDNSGIFACAPLVIEFVALLCRLCIACRPFLLTFCERVVNPHGQVEKRSDKQTPDVLCATGPYGVSRMETRDRLRSRFASLNALCPISASSPSSLSSLAAFLSLAICSRSPGLAGSVSGLPITEAQFGRCPHGLVLGTSASFGTRLPIFGSVTRMYTLTEVFTGSPVSQIPSGG